jgi:hypothetical protein
LRSHRACPTHANVLSATDRLGSAQYLRVGFSANP